VVLVQAMLSASSYLQAGKQGPAGENGRESRSSSLGLHQALQVTPCNCHLAAGNASLLPSTHLLALAGAAQHGIATAVRHGGHMAVCRRHAVAVARAVAIAVASCTAWRLHSATTRRALAAALAAAICSRSRCPTGCCSAGPPLVAVASSSDCACWLPRAGPVAVPPAVVPAVAAAELPKAGGSIP